MEKDDEVKGQGNSYTTYFRKFDPRLGRTFSLDPVMRAEFSMYSMMSNNPIIMIDPRGDDDYFSVTGQYLGSDNKKTNFIRVVCEGHESSFYSSLVTGVDPVSISSLLVDYNFHDWSNFNMLVAIANYYSEQLGVHEINGLEVDVDKNGKRNSVMFTRNKEKIFISLNEQGNISPLIGHIGNMKSTIVHEDGHVNDKDERTRLDHTERYLEQIDHETFDEISEDYKESLFKHSVEYLNEYIRNSKLNYVESYENRVRKVKERVNDFNQRSFFSGYRLNFTEEEGRAASVSYEKKEAIKLEAIIITN